MNKWALASWKVGGLMRINNNKHGCSSSCIYFILHLFHLASLYILQRKNIHLIIYKIEMSCNSEESTQMWRCLHHHHQINRKAEPASAPLHSEWASSPSARWWKQAWPTYVTNGPEPHPSCKLTIIYIGSGPDQNQRLNVLKRSPSAWKWIIITSRMREQSLMELELPSGLVWKL